MPDYAVDTRCTRIQPKSTLHPQRAFSVNDLAKAICYRRRIRYARIGQLPQFPFSILGLLEKCLSSRIGPRRDRLI